MVHTSSLMIDHQFSSLSDGHVMYESYFLYVKFAVVLIYFHYLAHEA